MFLVNFSISIIAQFQLCDEVNAEQDIVIGDCLTRDQAEDIINVLVKEADLQDLLVDAQFRSDQHRRNYATLKAQHEKILHQVKIMETEIIKLENEKKDMEIEISGLVDQAVEETNKLKRENAILEAQIPSANDQQKLENKFREDSGKQDQKSNRYDSIYQMVTNGI